MHRSRALIALGLSLCLLLGTAAPALGVTGADLQKHRDAAQTAREKAAAAEAAAKKLAEEVAALDERVEKLQAEAAELDPQIAAATKRTDKLQSEVARLRTECKLTQAEIDKTQAEYDEQRALLANRVEASYKQGTWFYLDLLLGSQDISDLISRTELVSRVIESNNTIATNLSATKDSLSFAKVKLERSLEQVNLKKREAAAVEQKLRSLRDAREAKANEQEAVQDHKADLMADNRRNAKRLRALAEAEEAESERIAAQLSARGGGSGRFAGTMAWPVPASRRITSPYGWRICPFHGRELHPAIDVGAAQGSAIVAAGDGVVISASYRGGYGNTIIIDHGEGVVTLYAHQASGGMKVGAGAEVKKGQRIGTVGSTGNSTGPHLHFEVRVNGAAKNPMGFM